MQLGLLFFSLKMSLTCMLLRRWLVARKWSSLVKLAVLSANFSAVSHMVCSSSSREHVTGNVLCKPSALLHTGHVHSAKGRIQFGSCSSKIVGDRYNTVHTGVVRAADPQLCSQYNTLPSFLGFPSVINHTAKTLVQSVLIKCFLLVSGCCPSHQASGLTLSCGPELLLCFSCQVHHSNITMLQINL